MSIFSKPMYAKNPIRSIRDNLILTKEGDIWAYYRIKADEINPNNMQKLDQSKEKWATLFRKVLPKYGEFELFLYPKDKQIDLRFQEFETDWATDDPNLSSSYASRTTNLLKRRLGRVTESDYVVGIHIKNLFQNENILEAGKRVSQDVADKLINWLTGAEVDESEIFESVKEAEENLYRVIAGRRGLRLTEFENEYLNRLNYIRNIEHDAKFEVSHKRMTDTVIDSASKVGFLNLYSDVGESTVSFLPVAEFEKINIAYNHLFQLAEKQDFPCEFRVKGRYTDPSGVTGLNGKVGRMRKRQKVDMIDTVQADGEITDKTKINALVTKELVNELDNKEPMIEWLACFVVYGKNVEECKIRTDRLMDTLLNLKIQLSRPSAKQLFLFYQFLQGNSIEKCKDWLHLSNGYSLAEMCFGVSNNVGTNTGWYLGVVDPWLDSGGRKQSVAMSRSIVLYSMLLANQGQEGAVTDSPHIAITGETGKGKSYLAGILFFQACLTNAQILMIDPKKEKRKQIRSVLSNAQYVKKYPYFASLLKRINFVTLDAKDRKNHGVLDPIVFLTGVDAKDTALGMIESIYSLDGKDLIETAINKILDEVISEREFGEKVGLLTVVERLEKHKEKSVQQAGQLLRAKTKNSLLELGFSNGDTAGLDLTKRITVLEIEGLDLPDADQVISDYTDMNRKSICMMLPLGKFCEKFGNADSEKYTIEFFDEAWVLEKAKRGKQILKSMKRVGRSMSNILVYITQSVRDTRDESGTGNFGVVFAFDDKDEREVILDHIGIEKNERNQKLLKSMKKGQCLMRDIYGRVAKLSVDNLFEEWDLALQTVKQTASSDAERKFA